MELAIHVDGVFEEFLHSGVKFYAEYFESSVIVWIEVNGCHLLAAARRTALVMCLWDRFNDR